MPKPPKNRRKGFFGHPENRKWGSEVRTNPVTKAHVYQDGTVPFTIPRKSEQEIRKLIGIRRDHHLVFFKSGEEFFIFVPRMLEKTPELKDRRKFLAEQATTPNGIYLQITDPLTIGIVKEGLRKVKH